jgi:putative oxidoreductase
MTAVYLKRWMLGPVRPNTGGDRSERRRREWTGATTMNFIAERTTAPYAAFLLRVSMGVMLLAHGLLLKVMTFGLAGTMGFFGSLGFPPVLGAVVAFAEIAAGLALIAGVWVRLASLLTIPIMLGATIQHLPAGWLFNAQGGGWEFPAFWTVALLVQAGLGAGAFALDVDRLIGRTATANAAS